VAQNIVSTDYEHSSSEVQIILDRVREFIDQHFPQTGEGSTGVKVCAYYHLTTYQISLRSIPGQNFSRRRQRAKNVKAIVLSRADVRYRA
jgi:hypothetical protein